MNTNYLYRYMLLLVLSFSGMTTSYGETLVSLETNHGLIQIALDEEKAPVSVANFLQYMDSGFYDGLLFHRVISGFMIQGGGFSPNMLKAKTNQPIVNEADNGIKNLRGSVAMARTNQKDSATSQFFINLVDNSFLDHGPRGFGYAVFGQVIKGMDVVDKIAGVKTGRVKGFSDVPLKNVVINKAYRVKEAKEVEPGAESK